MSSQCTSLHLFLTMQLPKVGQGDANRHGQSPITIDGLEVASIETPVSFVRVEAHCIKAALLGGRVSRVALGSCLLPKGTPMKMELTNLLKECCVKLKKGWEGAVMPWWHRFRSKEFEQLLHIKFKDSEPCLEVEL